MKKLKKKIKVTVEITPSGYSAYAENLNVFSTGQNVAALHNNLIDALNFYYEDYGYYLDASNINLRIDLQQFFKYYKVLNAKFLAQRIGMNPTLLSQYVQGKKHPSRKQTDKIIQGIQKIGRELADVSLV